MKIKVKQECPFCGGNEIIITSRENYDAAKSGCICITCTNCKTDVWYFGDFNDSYAYNTEKAREKWNTRFKAWDQP